MTNAVLMGSVRSGLVLTSSLAAHGMPMGEAYAASKGAINALVGSLDRDAPFRYLRLREPPYDEESLRTLAGQIANVG